MSFKIFSLQLFGKLKPVEKIEEQRKKLESDYREFISVEKSDELKDFTELEKWVNSDELKKQKEKIKALQFKGSSESKQLDEFAKLSKQKNIKNYFKVLNSSELKRFKSIESSEKLKKYNELSDYVKNGSFQKEKKEIEKQVYRGSNEEKQIKDLKKLKKSAGIKAHTELKDSTVLKKHIEFKNSEKLNKFNALKNSPSLDKEKQKEFKRLKKDTEIRNYLKFENSKKLKLYNQTENSSDLKRYEELVQKLNESDFNNRVSYLKDKKKFEKTEAYKKGIEFKKLSSDDEIKFFYKYQKSGLYKNYLNVKDASDLKRFNELKELTSSQEFLDRKAYLEDKQKWEKTEEHKRELKYAEMKALPHLVKYFKYKGSSDFDFFNAWEVVFEDNFSTPQLNNEKWSTTGFIAEKMLGDNYSMPGDLHVFTKGKNVKLNDKLTIETKKEVSPAKIWKMPAGFITADLDYTTGLISTGKSFWQEDGIYEAKIVFNPVKQVVSSFYLNGENNVPRVNLLEMGIKSRIGISTLNEKGKVQMEGMDISNLKKGSSYIFSIEKSGNNFTWKINEVEIFTTSNSKINNSLHINASSIVLEDIPGSVLPVKFEIDWVKCYRKK